jgi:bisphosphoglycerate-independent phosphoglycerate mutase (AlkP superfamily)
MEGIVNIPSDNLDRARAMIEKLQTVNTAELLRIRSANDRALDEHFHWQRFANQVIQTVEEEEAPVLWNYDPDERLKLAWYGLVGQMPLRLAAPRLWTREFSRRYL